MSDKVLFADAEVSIHQLDAVDGSKTLLPGQCVALADLPPYQREAALAGKIYGARVLTVDEAELIQNQAALLRGEVTDPGEEETPEVEEVETEETVVDEPVEEVVVDEPETEVTDEQDDATVVNE